MRKTDRSVERVKQEEGREREGAGERVRESIQK